MKKKILFISNIRYPVHMRAIDLQRALVRTKLLCNCGQLFD